MFKVIGLGKEQVSVSVHGEMVCVSTFGNLVGHMSFIFRGDELDKLLTVLEEAQGIVKLRMAEVEASDDL